MRFECREINTFLIGAVKRQTEKFLNANAQSNRSELNGCIWISLSCAIFRDKKWNMRSLRWQDEKSCYITILLHYKIVQYIDCDPIFALKMKSCRKWDEAVNQKINTHSYMICFITWNDYELDTIHLNIEWQFYHLNIHFPCPYQFVIINR